MSLKEIRKQNHLTQKQAAELVGIPYRTYIRYEENDSYSNTFKYRMVLSELSEKTKIDEEHEHLSKVFKEFSEDIKSRHSKPVFESLASLHKEDLDDAVNSFITSLRRKK